MVNHIKSTSQSVESDPLKTEHVLEETPNKETVAESLAVNAETVSDPDDPTKTITTLSKPKGKVKVKVLGPFNGETEVDSGTILKDALKNLNTENETYGKYKYRDQSDSPVGIQTVVENDLVLTAIAKA